MVDLKEMAYFKISLSTRNWDRAFLWLAFMSEPALAAWPGAVEGGMALMPPSATAKGVLARETSRRMSGPVCARGP